MECSSNGDVPLTDILKKDTVETAFKAPSFVLASKKKIKTSSEAEKAFQSSKYEPPGTEISDKLNADKAEKISEDGPQPVSSVSDEGSQNAPDSAPDDPSSVLMEPALSDGAPTVPYPVVMKPMLSPAEQLKLVTQTTVPYKEPPWSSVCEEKFALEVIKNGAVVDNIDLTTRNFHIVGRLPSCDIPMEHPSLSRHHAVIQYSGGGTEEFPRGWYLYDLDSTHGTWINKNKVPQKKFHRIHVDYVLKFGGSTRLFILQGPDTDRQEESELSVSEMKEQREKQLKEAELLRQAEMEEAERKAELIKQREELVGCSWGINENEEVEEDENAENPFAALEPENESLYINDPKKSLNSYFEREGLELPEYDFHEAGFGKWKCSIELPIDSPNGEPMVAEVVVSGKKKDAVVACALEACRILDKHGELRKSAQESRKKKGKNWEDDDFYDSDEDTYLDRTGVIEKKREMRKHKVGKSDQSTETYDTLMAKHEEITKEIEEIEAKLAHAKAQAAAMDSDDLDALDAYMSAIKSGMMDTKTKMKLKRQLMELKQEEQKVRKLVNIAKPASLPAASAQKPDIMKAGITTGIGKIKGPSSGKVVKKVVPVEKPKKRVEEEDESEEDEEDNQQQTIQSETKKESVKVQYNQDIEISTGKPKSTIGDTTTQNGQNEKVNSIKTNPRQKGPSLPLAAVLEKLQEEATEEENKMENSGEDKTMGKRKTVESSKSKSKRPKSDTGYSEDDPDYAVWLPPQNQSGDGKTHLNEKLGY